MDKFHTLKKGKNLVIVLFVLYFIGLFFPYYNIPSATQDGSYFHPSGWSTLVASTFPGLKTLHTILAVEPWYLFYSQFAAFVLFVLAMSIAITFRKRNAKIAIGFGILGGLTALYVASFLTVSGLYAGDLKVFSLLGWGYYLTTALSILLVIGVFRVIYINKKAGRSSD